MARPPNDGNARRSTGNSNGLFTTSSIKMIAIDDQPVSDAARKLFENKYTVVCKGYKGVDTTPRRQEGELW
jgi:hypothetical protein